MKIQNRNGIHFLEKTSYCENRQTKSLLYNVFWRVATAVLATLLIVSTYALLFEGVFFSYPVTKVTLVMAPLCMIVALVSLNRKIFVGIYGIFAIVFGVYTYLQWSMIKVGFGWFFDRCKDFADAYFNGHFVAEPVRASATGSFYVWSAMLLFLYISFVLFGFYKVFLAVLPAIACMIWPFCVGYVPHGWSLIGVCFTSLLLSCLFYGMGRFGRVSVFDAFGKCLYIRKQSSVLFNVGLRQMIVVGVVCVIIFGGTLIVKQSGLMPKTEMLETQNKQLKQLLEGEIDFFESIGTSIASSGGISKGDLASAGNLYYTGEAQLIIKIDGSLTNTLYIKGYVGDYYKDNHWIAERSNAYLAFEDDNELLNLPYYHLGDGESNIEIEKLKDFDDLDFIAYGALSVGQDWLNDLYIKQDSEENTYIYKPSFYSLSEDYESLIQMGQNDSSLALAGVDSQTLSMYEDYVYERYTKLPKGYEDYFSSFYSVMPQTLSQKIVWVKSFLNERCTYSLMPGYTPEGKDCVKYFLDENRTGYCMHFASSAVLLLRSMGVPTRYVEGYVLAPGSFKMTGEKKTAFVYDHQAHAWPEIYIDGFGWVPVEVTPTYYDAYTLSEPDEIMESESEPDEIMESESETDSITESESAVESEFEDLLETKQETSSIDDGSSDETIAKETVQDAYKQPMVPKDNKLKLILTGGLKILGGILLVAFVLFGQYYVRKMNKNKNMRLSRKEHALVFAYKELVRLMKFGGYAIEVTDPMDHIMNAGEYFTYLDRQQLQSLAALCNRAAFGPGDMSKESILEGIRMCRKIRSDLLKHLSFVKKYYIILICCL